MNKIHLTEEKFPSKSIIIVISPLLHGKWLTERLHEDCVDYTKHICEYLEQCVKPLKRHASYDPQGVQYGQKRVRLHHIIPTVGASTLNIEPWNVRRKDTQRTTRVILALSNMNFFLREWKHLTPLLEQIETSTR